MLNDFGECERCREERSLVLTLYGMICFDCVEELEEELEEEIDEYFD